MRIKASDEAQGTRTIRLELESLQVGATQAGLRGDEVIHRASIISIVEAVLALLAECL